MANQINTSRISIPIQKSLETARIRPWPSHKTKIWSTSTCRTKTSNRLSTLSGISYQKSNHPLLATSTSWHTSSQTDTTQLSQSSVREASIFLRMKLAPRLSEGCTVICQHSRVTHRRYWRVWSYRCNRMQLLPKRNKLLRNSLSVHTQTRSTTPKTCAITAITRRERQSWPPTVHILTNPTILTVFVKTAISPSTISKESKRSLQRRPIMKKESKKRRNTKLSPKTTASKQNLDVQRLKLSLDQK